MYVWMYVRACVSVSVRMRVSMCVCVREMAVYVSGFTVLGEVLAML